MLYGVMLRDPLKGMKSTLIGNEFEKSLIFQAIRNRVPPRTGFGEFFVWGTRGVGGVCGGCEWKPQDRRSRCPRSTTWDGFLRRKICLGSAPDSALASKVLC